MLTFKEKLSIFFRCHFMPIWFFFLASVLLVDKSVSIWNVALQTVGINLYQYFMHVIYHQLPSSVFFNMHVAIHHDKKITLPRWADLMLELFVDIIPIIWLILFQKLINFEIFSPILLLFYGLLYSTNHVINLSLFKNDEHRIHHIAGNKNFTLPYMDLLFNTMEPEKGKPMDDTMINAGVIFLILKLLN